MLPQYETAEKGDETPGFLEICWPLAAGLVLGFLSPYFHDVLANQWSWANWVAFPFAELASRPEPHLRGVLDGQLPHLVLWIQFPLEGLLTMWNLRRRVSLQGTLAILFSLHALGVFLVWLLNLNLIQL